jgi:two-component system cell cycle response regulator
VGRAFSVESGVSDISRVQLSAHSSEKGPSVELALLTEDRELAEEITELSHTGFRVTWADSRDEAATVLARRAFSVVLVDARIYDGASRQWMANIGSYLSDLVTVVVADEGWHSDSRELSGAVGVLRRGFKRSELTAMLGRAALLHDTREDLRSSRRRCRVLIVEGFPPDALLVRDLLEDTDLACSVTSSSTVEDALEKLKQEDFAVVISALELPDAMGLDAVVRLRAVAPHVPLIVMSDQQDRAMATCATRLGADEFMLKNALDAPALATAIRRSIEYKAREKLLERRAALDRLTGMPNRTALEDRLASLAAASDRTSEPLLVLLVDLDGFKAVNDSLGHVAGDELLIEMARRIGSVLRASDFAARLGGDEFVVLAPRAICPKSLVERLSSALDVSVPTDEGTIRITASVGVARYPLDADTVDGILALADRDMYAKKRNRDLNRH